MNHQPFERWLLDRATLDKVQSKQLRAHLESCPTCRRLSCNLDRVEQKLSASPPLQPRVDFALRFQASLSDRIAARQRRQAWSMIISGLSIGAAAYIYHLLPALSSFSFSNLFSAMLNNVFATVATILHIQKISEYLLIGVPPTIPLAVWISLTTIFAILSLIWVLALGRILVPKGDKA